MAIGISGDIGGLHSFRVRLDRFGDNTADAEPIFNGIADVFARNQAANFGSGGGIWGSWVALSPDYAAWKSSFAPNAPIMTLTGRLRESLSSRPFGIEQINKHRMEIGTDVPYAVYHQRGMGNNPVRKLIHDPTTSELRQYSSIFHRFAFEGVTE